MELLSAGGGCGLRAAKIYSAFAVPGGAQILVSPRLIELFGPSFLFASHSLERIFNHLRKSSP